MKRHLLALIIGILMIVGNGYAADGDMTINGNLTVGGTITAGGGGIGLLQLKYTSYNTRYSGIHTLPFDDSIPQQSTDGYKIMEQTITPKNANNILVIEAEVPLTSPNSGLQAIALFKDTTANALKVGWHIASTANEGSMVRLRHVMLAGTTSPIVFKIHIGTQTNYTIEVNGLGGSRYYGGVLGASMTIMEIQG